LYTGVINFEKWSILVHPVHIKYPVKSVAITQGWEITDYCVTDSVDNVSRFPPTTNHIQRSQHFNINCAIPANDIVHSTTMLIVETVIDITGFPLSCL